MQNFKILGYLLALFLCTLASLYSTPPQKTIGIFTYTVSGLSTWDPDSIKKGITGSEEAVIYLSQKLANRGYKVVVFGNPPQNSSYSQENQNPRYVPVQFPYNSKLDIAVSWRMPTSGSALKQKATKVYLWPHDTYHWPVPKENIDAFNDVLWISEWQRTQWISINPGFEKFKNIYGNGVILEQFEPIQDRINPYSCIYGSNYARGLAILLNIWPEIKKQFPKATLDIYYGWQHWGLLTATQEASMRQQVIDLTALDVHEHGLVGHEELNKAYAKASLWTYPCTAPECFSITALRAQGSGAIPVIIEGTALKETVRHGYKCASSQQYLQLLTQALQQVDKIPLEQRKQMRKFIEDEYTWDKIADKWIKTFEQ
jgi:glycosyltransferase involved in cell wall biosynthesis